MSINVSNLPIKRLRQLAGMTQAEVCQEIGMPQQVFSKKYENKTLAELRKPFVKAIEEIDNLEAVLYKHMKDISFPQSKEKETNGKVQSGKKA